MPKAGRSTEGRGEAAFTICSSLVPEPGAWRQLWKPWPEQPVPTIAIEAPDRSKQHRFPGHREAGN